MNCTNCLDEGKVALTNSSGQIYKFEVCPICLCKACGGSGEVVDSFKQSNRAGSVMLIPPMRKCEACQPDQFDAHVRLRGRLIFMAKNAKVRVVQEDELARGAPNPFMKLEHSKEFYESVYRRCLNPFQRVKRFLTHKKDGTKR